jgi:carbamoyltransferase
MEDNGLAQTIAPIESFYMGPAPASETFDKAAAIANADGFIVDEPHNLQFEVARLLAEGHVVARFEGAEEFGARALGNRSILANPANDKVTQVINRAIKNRDFWMPFACSVLKESEARYIANPKNINAPYMILAFDSRNTPEIIAGCHPEDGTIRPQVVIQSHNPAYHRLIQLFEERTGCGALLNTSFNMHGEPIVSQPHEAVDVMKRSGLKYLALGKYLISKGGS